MTWIRIILVGFLVSALFACSSPNVQPPSDVQTNRAAETQNSDASSAQEAQQRQATEANEPPPPPKPVRQAPRDFTDRQPPSDIPPIVEAPVEPAPEELPTASIPEMSPVYFGYNQSAISDAGQQALQQYFEWLQQHPEVTVQLQGHADERGSHAYNLALGERRARAVQEVLLSLGLRSQRLSIISFGEEQPAVLGHHEDAWQQNRRVEFVVR